MNEKFHVSLEARDPEAGIMRAYSIDADKDLLGDWRVDVRYGRIGKTGREVSYTAPDESEAQRIIRKCLQRRSTAPRRIGVPYRLCALQDPHNWTAIELF